MALGDIYVGVVHSTYQANANVFCMYFLVTEETNEAQIPADIANYMKDEVVPALQLFSNDNVNFRCTTARQVWPDASIEIIEPVTQPAVGALITVPRLPGQCSAVAQLITDQSDPTSRNRGRDFHYGATGAELEASGVEWTAAYIQLICDFYQTLGNVLTPGVASGTFEIGIFSRTQAVENDNPIYVSNGGSTPDPPTFGDAVFNQLTMARMNPLVRTQRRRQPEDPCRVYIACPVPA